MTMSDKAKEARKQYQREYQREYMKQWRRDNKEKAKAINERYWEKKAREMKYERR